MLEPGSVNAGDEVLLEFGNRRVQRRITKVEEVLSDGTIIIESGCKFSPDGTLHPIYYISVLQELSALTPEIRQKIEQGDTLWERYPPRG